jgi:hypothetical protein
MSLIVNSGYKSLNLYFTPPANAYYIDDISTSGTQQLQDDSLRTDVDKIYIWVGDTTEFPVDVSTESTTKIGLVYSGSFQTNIIIDKINISTDSIPDLKPLADNKTYYIRYAITSKLDPDQLVVSSEVVGTTLDISLEIQGWLTRDPIEIETDSDGNLPTVFPPTPNNPYTGTFTVYKYSENITVSANTLQYEIVSDSNTGGVTATIVTTNGNPNKGNYAITSITDLVGTVTLRATYTDPANSARIIIIDKILNVSKRRPGASASVVELNSTGIAFVKTANTGEKYPNQVVLSATATNITAPVYKWYEAGVSDTEITFASGETNSDSHQGIYTRNLSQLNELTVSNSLFNNFSTPSTKIIRVKVTTPTIDPVFEVSDTYTLYYLQEGSDALALGILNDNQTVSFSGNTSDSTIRNSGIPLTTKLVIVRGTTLIDPSITDPTNINSMAANNISSIAFTKSVVGIIDPSAITIANNGDVTITRNTTVFPPDTFLSAEIIFTATVTFIGGATTTLTKGLNINAAFDGQAGVAYWLVNNPKLLIKQKNGTLNSTSISWTAKQSVGGTISNYTTGVFNVYKDSTLLTINTDYTVNDGVVTVSSLDATANYYRAELYSDSLKTKLVDQDDIQIYEEGTDGIIVFNDNKNHTLARTSTGAISSYLGTGTYFTVQQGNQVFTAKITGASYSWNSTDKKLSITQTLAAGQYYIKSIKFDSNVTVTNFNPTSNWSNKFTIRNNTDLIFEDWSNIELDAGTLQAIIEFEIEYKKVDGTLGTQLSTQRIGVVKDASTIIVDVENDAHQIPFNTANVGIYTYSGTKIQAFDSNQELQYVDSTSTLNSGEWKIVSAVGTGITASTIPQRITAPTPIKWAQVLDHSDLTTDTAKIDYTITAKTYRGVEVTGILAGQTFTKVKNATAVYRIVGATNIVRFNNNSFSSLTVTGQKLEGGVGESFAGWLSYQVKLNNGTFLTLGNGTTESTRVQNELTISLPQGTSASNVIVKLYKDQTGGSTLDSADLPIIPQGQDGNLKPWVVKTSNYTAERGDRIIADTRNGTFTIDLPLNPNIGDSVTITDGWDFKQIPLTVGRNGSKIVNKFQQGEENNISLDILHTTFEFIYTGTVRGWDFTSTTGPKGDEGESAPLLKLETASVLFVYDNATEINTITPPSIKITAVKQNIQGTVSFSATAYDKNNVALGSATLVPIVDEPDSRGLTADNFNTISGISDRLSIRYVKIVATLVDPNITLTDTITIGRVDNGSDTITHLLTNESHLISANSLGVISSYSGATTKGYIGKGAVNETMNWTITKSDSAELTTLLTLPNRVSTTGTIANITGTGPWEADIVNLSSGTSSITINSTISAVENSAGRLFTGSPTEVKIVSKTSNSIRYRVTGGGSPVAGLIGGLAVGENAYTLVTQNLADNTDSGTTTIKATKDQVSAPEKIFSVAKSKDGKVPVIIDITNDNVNIATNSAGEEGDYTLATTALNLYIGEINALPLVQELKITPSTGVKFSYTKNTNEPVAVTTGLETTIPISPAITTLTLKIDDLTNVDNGKLTIKAKYANVFYTVEFTASKVKGGAGGQAAVIYSIEAENELVYNPNTELFIPATVTYNAYSKTGSSLKIPFINANAKIRLEYSTNNIAWTTIAPDLTLSAVSSRSLATSTLPKTTKYVRYTLLLVDGVEKILDRETDSINLDGVNSSVITVYVENNNHNIPSKADGTVEEDGYLYSRTKVRVYESSGDNNDEMQYTTDAVPGPGYWTFSGVTSSGIATPQVKPPVVTGEKYAQVPDHSGMTAQTATITYEIKACSLRGVLTEGIFANQTFTKISGTAIYRIIGANPITKTRAGVYSSITVKGQRTQKTVTEDFGVLTQTLYVGATAQPESSRSATQTVNPATLSGVTSIIVKLYENNTSTTVLDTTEIKVISDGADAVTITIDVENDTHDIPSKADGTVESGSYLYSGTKIQVFANVYPNISEMTYVASNATLGNNQWKITSVTGLGITPGAIPAPVTGKDYVDFPNHSNMTGETAKVTYIIQAKPTGYPAISGLTAAQTFAKVRRTAIYRLVNTESIVIDKLGVIGQIKVNGQKIEGQTVTTPFGWITQQLDNGTESSRTALTSSDLTNSNFITSALATTKTVTLRLYDAATGGNVVDTATIKVIKDGIDNQTVIIDVENDTHDIPAKADGSAITLQFTGTIVQAYENTTALQYVATSSLTTNGTFTITAVNAQNITASINATATNKPAQTFIGTALQTYLTIPDHTAIAANVNTASITYTFQAKTSTGVLISGILGNQTFAKINRTGVYRLIGAAPIIIGTDGLAKQLTLTGQLVDGNTVISNAGWLTQTPYTLNSSGVAVAGSESSSRVQSLTTNAANTNSSILIKMYDAPTGGNLVDRADLKVAKEGLSGQSVDIIFTRIAAGITPTTTSNGNPPMGNTTWSSTVSGTTGTNPLWSCVGYSNAPYTAWTWEAPTRVTGESVVEVSAYRRSSAATVGKPTGGSYNFVTKVLTQPIGNPTSEVWYDSIPAGTEPIWESRSYVTDIAPASMNWSNPVRTTISSRSIDVTGIVSVKYDSNKTTGRFSPASLSLSVVGANLIGTVTYSWTAVSAAGVTITNSTSANATLTFTDSATTDTKSIKVTVTDSIGSLEKTIYIPVVEDAPQSVVLTYSNDAHLVPIVPTVNWTGSGGVVTVYDGTVALSYSSLVTSENYPTSPGQFNLRFEKISGDTLSTPTPSGTTLVTIPQWAGTLTQSTVYRIHAYVRTQGGATVALRTDATLVPSKDNISYRLSIDPAVITKLANVTGNQYQPTSLAVKLEQIVGNNLPAAYAGRFIIQTTTSATPGSGDWAASYISLSNESSYTYTIPTNIDTLKAVRVVAYLAGGTTTPIDLEIANIITNGTNGLPGLPGLPAKGLDLNTTGGSFRKNTATNAFNPANFSITALPQNLTSPITYSWTVSSGATLSASTGAGPITVTPGSGATGSITVTVTATESGGATYQKTVVFAIVTDGIGTDGKRTGTGYVYYQTATSSSTGSLAKPTADSYTFTTGTFSGGSFPTNWSTSSPQYTPQNQQKYWAATYTCTENTAGGNSATGANIQFGTPSPVIGFTGLVAFTDIFTTNTTTIDGGKITTNSIKANSIDTTGLTIKNSSGAVIFGGGTALDWSNISSLYPSAIVNSSISLNSNGTLSGGGGGQVTIGGLGYTGALDANKTSIDANGAIQGVASGTGTIVSNSQITVNSAGQLAGIGTPNVLVDNSKVTLTKNSSNQLVLNNGSSTNTIPTGAFAFIDKILKSNAATFMENGLITNAFIGNIISSSNFNGTINETTGTVSGGTAGWAIGKGGHAIFNSIDIRGKLSSGNTGGKVELGDEIGPSPGHAGLTLSENNWNNVFMRRKSDNFVFFRVGTSDNYLDFNNNSNKLVVRGDIVVNTLTADRVITTGNISNNSLSNTYFSTYYYAGGWDAAYFGYSSNDSTPTFRTYDRGASGYQTIVVSGLPAGEFAQIISIVSAAFYPNESAGVSLAFGPYIYNFQNGTFSPMATIGLTIRGDGVSGTIGGSAIVGNGTYGLYFAGRTQSPGEQKYMSLAVTQYTIVLKR